MSLAAAAALLSSAAPADADTSVGSVYGQITVNGGEEANTLHITESVIQKTPHSTPDVPVAGVLAALPKIEEFERQLRIAASPMAVGSQLSQRVMALVGSAISLLILELANPRTEREIETEVMIVVTELGSADIHAVYPCEKLRLKRRDGFETSFKAVGCGTQREYASEVPPNLQVLGNGGADQITLNLRAEESLLTRRVVGGTGADVIIGSPFADLLSGGEGADIMSGESGNDQIWGYDEDLTKAASIPVSTDNDTLVGGPGDDTVLGQWGHDLVNGGEDDDRRAPLYAGLPGGISYPMSVIAGLADVPTETAALQGGPGRDLVVGGTGRDTLEGGPAGDTLLARERDFGTPEEPDLRVDCDGRLGVAGDRFEYHRRSPFDPAHGSAGDPMQNCGAQHPDPITLVDLTPWYVNFVLRSQFPWSSPDDNPFP